MAKDNGNFPERSGHPGTVTTELALRAWQHGHLRLPCASQGFDMTCNFASRPLPLGFRV